MKPALNSHKRLKTTTTKQQAQKKVKKKKQKKRKTRHKDVKNSSIRQEKPTHTQQGAQQKKVEQAEGKGGGEEGKEEKGNVDAAFSLLRFALPNERRSTHKSNAKLHYFVISARPIHCHSTPPPRNPTPCCPLQGIKHCQK